MLDDWNTAVEKRRLGQKRLRDALINYLDNNEQSLPGALFACQAEVNYLFRMGCDESDVLMVWNQAVLALLRRK